MKDVLAAEAAALTARAAHLQSRIAALEAEANEIATAAQQQVDELQEEWEAHKAELTGVLHSKATLEKLASEATGRQIAEENNALAAQQLRLAQENNKLAAQQISADHIDPRAVIDALHAVKDGSS